jgi:hypothetical protein
MFLMPGSRANRPQGVRFGVHQALTSAQQATALNNIGAQQTALINGKIVESHASNAATFAIKTSSGGDPTPRNPVGIVFSDGTQASIVAPLSFTISSGSTLGTTSAIPFRLWHILINDAGTIRLGTRNCSDVNGIYGFPSNGITSSTAEGGAGTANSAGVTYTGVATTSKQFRIIGYSEYASGMATAGTWITSPSPIVLFVEGLPRPGDAIQSKQFSSTTTLTNGTAAYSDSSLTVSVTPTAAMNLVQTSWSGNFQIDTANNGAFVSLRRGGSVLGVPTKIFSGAANLITVVSESWLDAPGSAGSVTYVVSSKLGSTAGAATCFFLSADAGGVIQVAEIMG